MLERKYIRDKTVVKKLAMALFNVVLLSAIVYSASFSFATAQQNIPENSIFYHLLVKSMSVSSSGNALEINTEVTGSLYLLKNETEVRTGATVTYEVPVINDKKTLTETSTGIYSIPIAEKFIITPESAALDVKNLKIIPKEITFHINGIEKYNSQVSGAGNISVLDYIENYSAPPNTSVTGFIDNIQISTLETATYRIPVEIIVRQEVLNNGTPLSGTSLTYNLPNHNYRQTVVTDANGIADVRINETVLLTISNGTITQLAEPVQLPAESDVVAFWWGEPSPPPPSKENRYLSIAVATDKTQYSNGENVHISGSVADEKGNVGEATVSLTIIRKYGEESPEVHTDSTTTASDGSYSFDYRISSTAESGDYSVEVKASKADTSDIDYHDGTSSTIYKVMGPTIDSIDFRNYIEEYKANGNIVYRRGDDFEVYIIIDETNGEYKPNLHSIYLKIKDPSRNDCDACEIKEENSDSEVNGKKAKRFTVTIPSSNAVGKYDLEAELHQDSHISDKKTEKFYVIFNAWNREDDIYNVGFGETELDHYVVSDTGYNYYPTGELVIWTIQPTNQKIFSTAIQTISGETSASLAALKLSDKTRYSNDNPNDVIVGRWGRGNYKVDWRNAPNIINAWNPETNTHPNGQCIDFGGLLNAFER